jgi:hypothetical protein
MLLGISAAALHQRLLLLFFFCYGMGRALLPCHIDSGRHGVHGPRRVLPQTSLTLHTSHFTHDTSLESPTVTARRGWANRGREPLLEPMATWRPAVQPFFLPYTFWRKVAVPHPVSGAGHSSDHLLHRVKKER